MDEIKKLLNEDILSKENCNLCQESSLEAGEKSEYGAIVICNVGNSLENGWFATLSPKTGGDIEKDFSIQIMPFAHLTHFSQLNSYPKLAKNYGIIFAKINEAMLRIMAEDLEFKATSPSRSEGVSIATYGKTTTWKDKKEHLHIKVFPFRGNIGQPYTVDSSFCRKEIHKNNSTGEEFVKMIPIKKNKIPLERLEYLSKKLIELLR